ncbi:MAG: hypothetical protein NDJ24_06605 [Alphaproteobacteria bacterium]|nr:hypothetical protein [Alphaproteobacteria bacterium]
MTDNQKIHDTFAQVAPIQAYAVDQLITAVEKRKKHWSDTLRRRVTAIEGLLSTTPDEPTPRADRFYADTFKDQKRYSEAHNCLIILKHMKAQGHNRLELDTSKDMYDQILTLALKSENRPKGYELLSYTETGPESDTPTCNYLRKISTVNQQPSQQPVASTGPNSTGP